MPEQTTIERYREAARALLPPGFALSKALEGAISDLHEAIAVEYARVHELAASLLKNYDPAQAVEMLPEWEEALATVGRGTDAERQAALVNKLRGRRSHAKSVFERAAIQLGYGQETWTSIFDVPTPVGTLVAVVPDAIRSGRWRMRFTPRAASSDASYATQQNLFGIAIDTPSGFNYWGVLRNTGSSVQINVGKSGSDALLTGVSWTAGQQLTIEMDAVQGTVTLSGATTGNKTELARGGPWLWPPNTLNVGQYYAGVSTFDGTIDAIESYSLSGIEFKTYAPFLAGSSAAGDVLTNDEWANVVTMYVPVDTQTADETLLESFEYLRRAHGYLDIILEGPMGAERISQTYKNQAVMSASDVVAGLSPIAVRYSGYVSIEVLIDNGVGGAPSDAPAGTFEIWHSADGARFKLLTKASAVAELAAIAATGNALVDTVAIIDGVPGKWIKVRYNRSGGGGGNSRCTMTVTTW